MALHATNKRKDMKKKYQKPSIMIHEIETTDILAASPTVGGNTGITTGEGDPPSSGSAKPSLWNDDEGSAGNVWNSWDD